MTTLIRTALAATVVLAGAASANATSNPYLAVHGINGVAYGK